MNIILKRLSRLKTEEITFVFAMMSTYGDLKIEESPSQNTKNKNKNRNKGKTKKPPKVIKNHDDCKPEEPCLYDFDCPAWEQCDDDKFLQYRLIMKKCEKQ